MEEGGRWLQRPSCRSPTLGELRRTGAWVTRQQEGLVSWTCTLWSHEFGERTTRAPLALGTPILSAPPSGRLHSPRAWLGCPSAAPGPGTCSSWRGPTPRLSRARPTPGHAPPGNPNAPAGWELARAGAVPPRRADSRHVLSRWLSSRSPARGFLRGSLPCSVSHCLVAAPSLYATSHASAPAFLWVLPLCRPLPFSSGWGDFSLSSCSYFGGEIILIACVHAGGWTRGR